MFDFQFRGWLTPYINDLIRKGAENKIKDDDFVRREIDRFINSPKRFDMFKGYDYYIGKHDILRRKRTVIGEGGELEEVTNLPNARLVNNQYGKMVDQKVNYLLGKQIVVSSDNKTYAKLLGDIFNPEFDKLINRVGEDSLNCGIGWIYINYDTEGKLKFKRIKPWQIIPGWSNEEHTELDYAIRVYQIIDEQPRTEKLVTKVEVFEKKGITRFILDGGRLIPDGTDWQVPYFYAGNTGLSWDRIPLIPFKANSNELPLIKRIKSLQDALNLMLSEFNNGMEENPRNTILVIKNYDGEDLGEFRKNLSTYSAVKVSDEGGIETLSVPVNSDNYKAIIDLLKKAIIENAMGYDAKDDRIGSNANQLNIQSMYSDIDLDANKMETEYQSSLKSLMWFVNAYLEHRGQGSFDGEGVEFIFNRDMLINESEVIENCVKSLDMLSDETVIAMHPWVTDIQKELERIKKQREVEDAYDNTFKHTHDKIDTPDNKVGDDYGEE